MTSDNASALEDPAVFFGETLDRCRPHWREEEEPDYQAQWLALQRENANVIILYVLHYNLVHPLSFTDPRIVLRLIWGEMFGIKQSPMFFQYCQLGQTRSTHPWLQLFHDKINMKCISDRNIKCRIYGTYQISYFLKKILQMINKQLVFSSVGQYYLEICLYFLFKIRKSTNFTETIWIY